MANFYFFTDKELILPQSEEDVFGRVKSGHTVDWISASVERWRVSSMHKASVHPTAYASLLISRLDQVMIAAGKPTLVRDNLDEHTIYGQQSATNAKIDLDPGPGTNFIASYNQVLTALRCFGILEGITQRIKTQAEMIGADTDVITNIEDNPVLATVRTTRGETDGVITINAKELAHPEYIALKIP